MNQGSNNKFHFIVFIFLEHHKVRFDIIDIWYALIDNVNVDIGLAMISVQKMLIIERTGA